MTENPTIRYQGQTVIVTPDTARELVDTGEAQLISGDLMPPTDETGTNSGPTPTEPSGSGKGSRAKKPSGSGKGSRAKKPADGEASA